MDICILTVFHNPNNCEKKIKSFNKFLEEIKLLNADEHLYVCELSEKKISQFNNIKNLFFIQIKNRLNYNECAINYLLKNIPQYKKIIVIDYEVKIKEKDWIERISKALSENAMVQAFKTIKIKDHTVPGAVEHIKKTRKIKNNYFFGGITGYDANYLNYMNGLFDKCLLGGGETINTIPFFYSFYTKLDFLKTVCLDTQLEVLNYINKANSFIKKNKVKCESINLEVEHLSYNKINKSIFKLINQDNFSEIFYENKNKFYEPLDDKIEIGYIKKITKNNIINKIPEIRIFDYRKRKDPCNPNKIVWLSDNNTILFKNIKGAKLYFKKEKELKYFRIILDWKEIKANFSNNEFCLELIKPKSLIIISDFYIPKQISEGEDARKLSAFLYKVEIENKNNYYEEYQMQKIIIEPTP